MQGEKSAPMLAQPYNNPYGGYEPGMQPGGYSNPYPAYEPGMQPGGYSNPHPAYEPGMQPGGYSNPHLGYEPRMPVVHSSPRDLYGSSNSNYRQAVLQGCYAKPSFFKLVFKKTNFQYKLYGYQSSPISALISKGELQEYLDSISSQMGNLEGLKSRWMSTASFLIFMLLFIIIPVMSLAGIPYYPVIISVLFILACVLLFLGTKAANHNKAIYSHALEAILARNGNTLSSRGLRVTIKLAVSLEFSTIYS